MCHTFLTGALVGVLLQRPVVPRACSLSSASHGNHAGIQQSAIDPQLRVDAGVVPFTIPIDGFPLTLTNWMDHHSILPAPSRWSQERASQPRKTKLVTSYKNEFSAS
jgi:hypothetical protein